MLCVGSWLDLMDDGRLMADGAKISLCRSVPSVEQEISRDLDDNQ